MANSNLTFHSWVKIISDTATTYAKKGDNQNICFQSVFLYSIRVLAHIMSVDSLEPGIWGAVFKCPGCTWKIEESFTLNEVTYEGIPLESTIVDLRPRTQPKRINNSSKRNYREQVIPQVAKAKKRKKT